MTVEASISCGYTGTRYGECGAGREREVSQDARRRSACTELVREARAMSLTVSIDVSLESFYCDASFTNFFDEASIAKRRRRRKKEEALLRVLLIRWIVCIYCFNA